MKRILPILILLTGCTLTNQTKYPLHEAVKCNDSASVSKLISRGAPVDARDSNGLTPLMLACMNLQEENIRLLIRAGADPHTGNAAGTTAEQMLNRGDSIPSRAPACRRALQEEWQKRLGN
jgi:ankyrin repeat protein